MSDSVWPHRRQPTRLPVPGILQARTLEWVAFSFSNAWKWKVKVKSLSRVRLFETPWTAAYQAPPSMGFSRHAWSSGVPLPSRITRQSQAQNPPHKSFPTFLRFCLHLPEAQQGTNRKKTTLQDTWCLWQLLLFLCSIFLFSRNFPSLGNCHFPSIPFTLEAVLLLLCDPNHRRLVQQGSPDQN